MKAQAITEINHITETNNIDSNSYLLIYNWILVDANFEIKELKNLIKNCLIYKSQNYEKSKNF